jgi:hypothetical protein
VSRSDQAPAEPGRPLLRVVRGEPTPEELAALVAVLAARSPAPAAEPGARAGGGWGDHARAMRAPLPHGPGRWRAAALPR